MSQLARPRSPVEQQADPFAALNPDIWTLIITFLDFKEAARLSLVSRAWADLTRQQGFWLQLVRRDFPATAAASLPAATHSSNNESNIDWCHAYRKAEALANLRTVTWQQQRQQGDTPMAREGHAACPWGDGLLLFGGFGSGILNTVHQLSMAKGSWPVWTLPNVSGAPPDARYGHTLTLCGARRDKALLFGGMTRGGYIGEVAKPVLLQQLPLDAPPAAATQAGVALEWVVPQAGGQQPCARGYHSAAVSEDGTRVYIYGGISRQTSVTDLAVLDLAAEAWLPMPPCSGEPPQPRFGHSSVVWGGKLWVVGGGWGSDLLRSGNDYADVHALDLATWTWSQPEAVNACPYPSCLGRCHASALIGSKLLFFGGGLSLCNDMVSLDLATMEWGMPCVRGTLPSGRLSHSMVTAGGDVPVLLLYGGWAPYCYEMGDLHLLQLLPRDLMPPQPAQTVCGDSCELFFEGAQAPLNLPQMILQLLQDAGAVADSDDNDDDYTDE